MLNNPLTFDVAQKVAADKKSDQISGRGRGQQSAKKPRTPVLALNCFSDSVTRWLDIFKKYLAISNNENEPKSVTNLPK